VILTSSGTVFAKISVSYNNIKSKNVSVNQGELNKSYVGGKSYPTKNNGDTLFYNIIIVSRNEEVNLALQSMLQNFSLSGRSIQIFFAKDLIEARSIVNEIPDIVLVVVDDDIQVNGSYQVFVKFVREKSKNQNCCIVFKEDLINSSYCEALDHHGDKADSNQFYYARERLIDITRMVMLTTDMENKITMPTFGSIIQKNKEESSHNNTNSITKEKLYTVLAHDLKDPVSNIRTMLDFLTNEPELLDKQTSKDLLSRVKESANSMHELLEDFLFWSRMLNRDIYYNPSRINLRQLINETIVLLRSTADAKEICISTNIQDDVWIFADEYMLLTILRNMVYNAIKFTEESGSILITGNTSSSYFRVNVTDTGIGISQKNIEKLFRPDIYFSTEGTAKETGPGLGLVLCKDFVEKNGGEIFVESHEKIGSTFSFTVPLAITTAL